MRMREITELLLVVGFVVSCHAVQNTQQIVDPVFDREGHRGCRGLMPENTVPAMIRALELGVTTLEMDAVITADKKVVLSHEPFFNHEIATHPNGNPVTEQEEKSLNIFRMTYKEVQDFDVGIKGNPRFPRQEKLKANKPLLSEIIDDVEAYVKLKGIAPVFYNIETKTNPSTDSIYHPAPDEFVKLLLQVINRKKIASRVIIQSFDFRTLKIVHETYPDIRTAALVEPGDKKGLQGVIDELGFTPSIYSPHFSLVTPELIRQCHQKQIRIIPWTVNDKPTIEKLKSMGVDGIISDYPDLF